MNDQPDLGFTVSEPIPETPAQPPVNRPRRLVVRVRGVPRPQGNMTAQRVRRGPRTGQLAVYHANEDTLMPWRNSVAWALAAAHEGPPWTGPVGVHIVFTMPKPKSAPKTKHTWPIKRPDLDKLMRAVLDAGTEAGVWKDDSQVVVAAESKHFVADGYEEVMDTPGAYINIWEVA